MLLLATLMVFLPACSDDKDKSDNIKSRIIGTWDATSVKVSDTDWVDISDYPNMALSITSNKKCGAVTDDGIVQHGDSCGETIKHREI